MRQMTRGRPRSRVQDGAADGEAARRGGEGCSCVCRHNSPAGASPGSPWSKGTQPRDSAAQRRRFRRLGAGLSGAGPMFPPRNHVMFVSTSTRKKSEGLHLVVQPLLKTSLRPGVPTWVKKPPGAGRCVPLPP